MAASAKQKKSNLSECQENFHREEDILGYYPVYVLGNTHRKLAHSFHLLCSVLHKF
jgi:hypothetical protein